MERRRFLGAGVASLAGVAGVGALPFIAGCRKTDSATPPGLLQDAGAAVGHRLRSAAGQVVWPAASETRRTGVLIVGAGIGGLSASWRLQKKGLADFALLELADRPGGNARYADRQDNPVSPHPLGAHYLPLPTREAVHVRELLADLGAIEGDPQALRPRYDEARLCHTPQERLYRDGFWQDGIIPEQGLARRERDEIRRFQERMGEFREARDPLGRRAFALPVELSSPEPRWRALDRISMADWLAGEGFRAPALLWYVDYACRDDFGTRLAETSAWAGIHYFACRNGEAANAPADAVLTAPEGNGWMVRALAQRLSPHLTAQALVVRVVEEAKRIRAEVWLAAEKRMVRYEVEQLIWAAPLFVLPHVMRPGAGAAGLPAELAIAARQASYAPWLVANLTLREPPRPGAGAPLSWDNVLYGSPGLGYVVATHQNLRVAPGPTVLTWYYALADADPLAARRTLLQTPREVWAEQILGELSRAHGDIRELTSRLDVFRHGHAMIRPIPGSLWHSGRSRLGRSWGRLHLAHADVSGLSLFEEANYRGVVAADRALRALGRG